MSAKLLWRVGVCLMVAGAVAATGSSAAFTEIGADRTTTVQVAADPNGFLGVNSEGDIGKLKEKDGTVAVGALGNNLSQSVTVSAWIENIPGENDNILNASVDTDDLNGGETTDVLVRCNDSVKLNQPKDVVFGTEAIGSSVSIEGASFTVTIEIQCHKYEPTGLTNAEVTDVGTSADESQTFSFDLTQDMGAGETVAIRIEDGSKNKAIDYTSASFTSSSGSVTGYVDKNDYVLTFSPDQELSSGDSVSISVEGIDASGSKVTKESPYTVTFERSDNDGNEETTFSAG